MIGAKNRLFWTGVVETNFWFHRLHFYQYLICDFLSSPELFLILKEKSWINFKKYRKCKYSFDVMTIHKSVFSVWGTFRTHCYDSGQSFWLLVLTRVWLDWTESNALLSIVAHRGSQIHLSLCIGSLPAKDTSTVNSYETEHSQNEHTLSISSHWYWQ